MWSADGRVVSCWWRDDDAVQPSAALHRLVAMSVECHIPLNLAVVPAHATEALPRFYSELPQLDPVGAAHHPQWTRATQAPSLTSRDSHPGLPSVDSNPGPDFSPERPAPCYIWQHGYAHTNHAPPGEKKAELGEHRPKAMATAELVQGMARLRALFGPGRVLPALVPPWNRISPSLIQALPNLGYGLLSTFKARTGAYPGLRQVNCHLDPIDWRGNRGFRGAPAVLGDLVGHLRARRRGESDRDEPTGILTHHLDHDEAGWTFLRRLLERLGGHPAVRFLSGAELASIAPPEPEPWDAGTSWRRGR